MNSPGERKVITQVRDSPLRCKKNIQIQRVKCRIYIEEAERRTGTSVEEENLKLSPGTVPVAFLKPYASSSALLLQRLKGMINLQAMECAQPQDLNRILEKSSECILVCHASNQADLVQQVTLMKLLKDSISQGKLKVLLTTSFNQQVLFEKLKAYGFSEIIPEPIDDRKLAFRIDRIAKAFLIDRKKEEFKVPEMTENSPVQVEAPPITPPKEEDAIRMVSALKLESDFWLFQANGTRRVLDKWMVKMLGPGPMVGRFVAVDEKPDPASVRSEQWWQWVPSKSQKDEFLKENGTWYFCGITPRFEEGAWYFVGKNSELSFYSDHKNLGSKFSMDTSGVLNVTYDSLNAIRMRHQIESSVYEAPREEIAKAVENRFVLGADPVTPQAPSNPFSDKIRARLENAFGPATEEAKEIFSKLNQNAASILEQSAASVSLSGPEAIQAKKSLEPRLGPLALALLMSELVCKKGLSKEEIAKKFCAYVGASCGGVRVELWYKQNPQWGCAGTSDGSAGQLGTFLENLNDGAVRLGQTLAGTIISPNQKLLGALVISGPGVEDLSPEYALAAGSMALGLMETFVLTVVHRKVA